MSEQAEAQETTTETEQTTLLNAAPAEGETITIAEGEWLLSPEVKGVGEPPEWFKADKYKSVQAQAEAYNALESKLGGFTGAPDEYELNVPEGIEGEFDTDDPMIAGAREMAKEIGMNQEGFDKMVELYLMNTVEDTEQTQADQAAQLVEVLGDNHAQRISQVSGALTNMLDAETFNEIKDYVNTPQAVRLVEAVILASAPKVAPIDGGTNPEGFTMAKLNEMRSERISDGPNAGELRWHKDPDFRKQVQAYSQALHGE